MKPLNWCTHTSCVHFVPPGVLSPSEISLSYIFSLCLHRWSLSSSHVFSAWWAFISSTRSARSWYLSFSSSVALCTCSCYSSGSHFFKNFIKPFGERSRALRIADTLDFFILGLVGGVDVVLEANVLFIAADVPSINMLLTEEGLGPGEEVSGKNEEEDFDTGSRMDVLGGMKSGSHGMCDAKDSGQDMSALDSPP